MSDREESPIERKRWNFFSARPMHTVPVWLGMAALAGLVSSGNEALAQDPGEQIFQRECAVCHSLEPGENMVGPTMHDVIGRTAGGLEDFDRYSDALLDSDVVWDAETLDPWIEAPDEFIPGNTMAYLGLEDEAERNQLIEFLQQQNGEE